MANYDWYSLERYNVVKRGRTPSPSRPVKRQEHTQRDAVLKAIERYILPREENRPSWKQAHDKAPRKATIDARPNFERSMWYAEQQQWMRQEREGSGEEFLLQFSQEQPQPSIYEKQRDHLERDATIDELIASNMAEMETSDEEDSQPKQDNRSELEKVRHGLKTGFAALHPSLQVAIITEIVEDATNEKLPFYDANAKLGRSRKDWHGYSMDRSFYPSEHEIHQQDQGFSSASSQLPNNGKGSRHDSFEAVVAQGKALSVLPTRPKPSRVRSEGTPSSTASPACTDSEASRATRQSRSRVRETAPQPRHEAPQTPWIDSELHDPSMPGQRYYPADQLFGRSEEEVDKIFAHHRQEYRDEQNKAPSEDDIAKAEEFLRAHKLPRRWMNMWLADSE